MTVRQYNILNVVGYLSQVKAQNFKTQQEMNEGMTWRIPENPNSAA